MAARQKRRYVRTANILSQEIGANAARRNRAYGHERQAADMRKNVFEHFNTVKRQLDHM